MSGLLKELRERGFQIEEKSHSMRYAKLDLDTTLEKLTFTERLDEEIYDLDEPEYSILQDNIPVIEGFSFAELVEFLEEKSLEDLE